MMSDSIDVLVKLFETLKGASDDNVKTTRELIDGQHDLVTHIKHLPIKELSDALKEHSKESEKNIDSCTETVDSKNKEVMDLLRIVNTKITKMILVVIVAFTILAGSYVLIRAVADDDKKYKTWQQEMVQTHKNLVQEIADELRREIEGIREEQKLLHAQEDTEDESIHK